MRLHKVLPVSLTALPSSSSSSSCFLFVILLLSSPTVSHGFLQELINFLTNAIIPFTTQSSDQQQSQYFSRPSRQLSEQQDSDGDGIKCFGELGCVENTEEFYHILHRPFNLLPQDRHHVNTRFAFFNRNRTVDPTDVYLNGTHLLEQGFNPEKPVKFIAHGFFDSGFSTWITKLAQAFLVAGDFNVFVVDWGVGALPLYTQATANTRLVGLEIANYVQFLHREFGVKMKDCHCTGHSLGAHVCGYAGEKLDGELGRITGLDPAEPYFQHLPHQVRLDPSDAKFVDIVHTDGRTILLLGLGMIQPCGHVDFYPNDGKEQPGCELTEIPAHILNLHGYDEVEREVVACNHHRAVYYFIEAVLNRCQFVGHICDDYQTYLKGKCGSCGKNGENCALMGLDAEKFEIGGRSLLKFYLSTAKLSPFCVRHYQVNIQLARPEEAVNWVRGKLKMSIIGSKSSLNDINLTPTDSARFHHGKNLTFMVQNPKEFGNLMQVKVEWKSSDGYLGFMSRMSPCWSTDGCGNKLFIKRIQVSNMDDLESLKNDKSRSGEFYLEESEKESDILCGDEDTKYTGIISGSSFVFQRKC